MQTIMMKKVVWIRTIFALFAVFTLPLQGQAQRADALHQAVAKNDLAEVNRLIAAQIPLDQKDQAGQTPLLIAVQRDAQEIASALIAAGADINAQAANLDSPWLLAGASGRTQMLKLMIPRGPDLTLRNRFGGTALIPACEKGHVETVRLLLTTRIDVNHVNNLGWTCLLEIVLLGDGGPRHQEITRLVLAAGADPNLADQDRVTPLAHARKRGQTVIAGLIEKAGGRERGTNRP